MTCRIPNPSLPRGLFFHDAYGYTIDMPYNYAHALIGLLAREQVLPATRETIDASPAAFLIGTMGPDPYFGDLILKPLLKPSKLNLTQLQHGADARALFDAFANAAKSDAQKAYTLGYLCHFLLDSTAHPYIEARFSGKLHTPAEIALDLMLIDRMPDARLPAPPKRLYRTSALNELDALHADVNETLFGSKTRGVFARSYHKWLLINAISYDPGNRKLRFFTALSHIFGFLKPAIPYLLSHHDDPNDRLNLTRAAWYAPWSPAQARTESFPDLFLAACDSAPALLDAACASIQSGERTAVDALLGARCMNAAPLEGDA